MTGDDVRALMAESGLWTAVRQRPFDRVPSPSTSCSALFVTAADTNPLAGSVATICAGQERALLDGLTAISKITKGPTFFCVGPDWTIDVSKVAGVQLETFTGQHPAGLVGTHIHTLRSASRTHTVFHLGVQDVIALGHLVQTGQIHTERIVTLAGPAARDGRMLRTRLGACTANLSEGRINNQGGEVRLISGSVLHGNTAQCEQLGFLGRYSTQITALYEDRERVFFGWLMPGSDKFSTIRAHLSAWLPGKTFPLTTTTHGGHRAMVPIGMFERVMPLDIMATFLLRAIVVGDLENAEALGCLELHEEDLALCSFVSPGKEDFGKALRGVLTDIWKEG
jgi:Na+-transporting NADH:ubiquinone oxidoreductase subunit A